MYPSCEHRSKTCKILSQATLTNLTNKKIFLTSEIHYKKNFTVGNE